MTTRIFLALIALLTMGAAARAEVLIYAGTTQRTDAAENYARKTFKVFFLSDPATGETATFVYGKFDGQKRRKGGVIQAGDYFGGPLVTGTKDTDLYVFVRKFDDIGLQRNSMFLRGDRKDVQVNQIGGNPVISRRARVLKGAVRFLGAGLGSSYVEDQMTLTLDTTRTVDTNVRDVSFADAVEEMKAFLLSRGFLL